jgi:hypothetical protein
MSQKKRKIVIEERDDPEDGQLTPTTQARQYLYNLIAVFRKDAEESTDNRTQSFFEFAADVIAGLARAFRQHEAEMSDIETNEAFDEEGS